MSTTKESFVISEIGQVDNQGQFDPDRVDTRPQKLMWSAITCPG